MPVDVVLVQVVIDAVAHVVQLIVELPVPIMADPHHQIRLLVILVDLRIVALLALSYDHKLRLLAAVL